MSKSEGYLRMIEILILTTLKLLPYQDRAVRSLARFTWNCWARQTGKSFTFGLRRLRAAIRRRRTQVILSAGQRQSREVMLKVRQHCRALRIHCDISETSFYGDKGIRQLEITLPNGVRIIGLPANPLTARGYTGDIFLDEFAMHRDDEGIWSALFPALMRGNGELDVASTPRGRRNTFYKLQSSEPFTCETLTLEEAVANGLDIDMAATRAGIGDELAWRQEYCCEFADEATAFLTLELIDRCCDDTLSTSVNWPAIERQRAEIYVGIDLARKHDFTVIWVWERVGTDLLTRGVAHFQNATFEEQEDFIARLLSCRTILRCAVDASGIGMQFAERLMNRFGADRVEAVQFSSALKTRLAGRLRVAAERGQLRIPRDDDIVRDWHSIERIISSGSHVRFDADRSARGHADRFWAAALGVHAAGEPAEPLDYVTTGALRFASSGAP